MCVSGVVLLCACLMELAPAGSHGANAVKDECQPDNSWVAEEVGGRGGPTRPPHNLAAVSQVPLVTGTADGHVQTVAEGGCAAPARCSVWRACGDGSY